MRSAIIAATLAVAGSASGQIRISEWAYSIEIGEFIEFTNVGAVPVDMSGWAYDDDSRISIPGVGDAVTGLDLSAFGLVQPGESVVITEATEAAFRAEWSLAASVKVIGGYMNNLGRGDEINLFDNVGGLVDRLNYGDQLFPGTIRTQDVSGNPGSLAALGANDVSQWVLSSVGDVYGSYAGASFGVANPGSFTIPSPASAALMGLGAMAGLRRRR